MTRKSILSFHSSKECDPHTGYKLIVPLAALENKAGAKVGSQICDGGEAAWKVLERHLSHRPGPQLASGPQLCDHQGQDGNVGRSSSFCQADKLAPDSHILHTTLSELPGLGTFLCLTGTCALYCGALKPQQGLGPLG